MYYYTVPMNCTFPKRKQQTIRLPMTMHKVTTVLLHTKGKSPRLCMNHYALILLAAHAKYGSSVWKKNYLINPFHFIV